MSNPSAPEPQEKPEPKRMLSVETLEHGKRRVRINYSSLELLQTCLRKAHYSLNLELRSETESAALAFGSAIHRGLEHWYQLPATERLLPRASEEAAELMAFGHGLDTPVECGALESIRQFCRSRYAALSALPEMDKRSLPAGIRLLKAYFKHYAQDGFEVLRDSEGPLIERTASLTLYDSPELEIQYFGTIDVVLQHTSSRVIIVADHKTTSALGQEFYNRVKPNFQYTGYVMLAQKALGLNTQQFMINGIQTAKTKTEFARQITDRTEDDFHELKSAVVSNVKRWLSALDGTGDYRDNYPMNTPNPCAMYGGCQYRGVCEVPEGMKRNVIKMQYGPKQ